jgi:hypothetical protein
LFSRNPNKAALEALGEGAEPAHGAPVPLTISASKASVSTSSRETANV